MKHWPDKLFIYEINTCVWLNTLSRHYQRPITLASVPDEVLDSIAAPGLDVIWLMGAWTRSPYGVQNALKWKHQYRDALPDLTDADVIGSAYSISDYSIPESIGGRAGLAHFRLRLRERGLRLMLDFVPNHVGTDHAWTKEDGFIVRGTPDDLKRRASDFFAATDRDGAPIVLAHGRDPNFSGWADTAQLDAFNPGLRRAVIETLRDIAGQCDGVRCDMAMLLATDIFANTWRGFVGPAPKLEFWEEVIPQVRVGHPDFMFLAEVYWGREPQMLQQGFDYCYDKVLYDRAIAGDVERIRQHLLSPLDYQKQMMRFIENHDEHRAYAALGAKRSHPAATLICTLPGGTLLHDGQFVGRTVKLPVQITRQPDETLDRDLEQYYYRLLEETRDPVYQQGAFTVFDVNPSGYHDGTYRNLLAYGWHLGDDYRLITINMTGSSISGRVDLSPWTRVAGRPWRLYDVTDGAEYHRHGAEMTSEGLFVALAGYESHVFRFESLDKPQPRPMRSPSIVGGSLF
jgi:hypothetical protein